MIVQIYEIQTPGEAEAVITAGVDHVGSVVVDAENWKSMDVYDTIRVVAQSPAKSSLILLFNNADHISSALDYYRPDIVHFCDIALDSTDEWEAVVGKRISLQATVKERFPEIAIMRSIPVPPPGGALPVPILVFARYFEPLTDYFLTDTCFIPESGQMAGDQPVPGFIGITGCPCDWEVTAQLVSECMVPVIMAGGLSPDNVHDAILKVRPAGVDSCTNTNILDETGKPVRFKKDMEKVARFVAEAKRGGEMVSGSK